MGKYLDKIRQPNRTQPIETVEPKEVLTQQQALAPIPTIQCGDRIEWERADGTRQTGLVDAVHVDEDGQHLAFVTLGEIWAVVNMKFVTRSGDA